MYKPIGNTVEKILTTKSLIYILYIWGGGRGWGADISDNICENDSDMLGCFCFKTTQHVIFIVNS